MNRGATRSLIAGAAAREITPGTPLPLFGYPHVVRVSRGVHDPILASVLYLHDDKGGAALVSLDVLFLDPPTARAMRRRVADRAAVPEARVFIACTHTHSAPVTRQIVAWRGDPAMPPADPAWLRFVEDQAAAAAGEARAAARPAEIAWTSADASGAGGNRLDPRGPTDPEAGVLAVREAGGGPLLAAAVAYGMHPTVLHEDSPLVSSDFPHYVREEIRRRLGRDVTVLYFTAPAGDQSPRYFVAAQTFAEAERLGRRLGATVAHAVEGALSSDPWRRDGALDGRIVPVALSRREMPSVDQARAGLDARRARLEELRASGAPRPVVRTAECAVFGAEGALNLARAATDGSLDRMLDAYRPFEVQGVRIGDGRFVGLPGELFCELGLAIKRRSPPRTYPVSLVNGELQGYIVTPEAMAAGGYEADGCVFGPEAGDELVAAAARIAAELG